MEGVISKASSDAEQNCCNGILASSNAEQRKIYEECKEEICKLKQIYDWNVKAVREKRKFPEWVKDEQLNGNHHPNAELLFELAKEFDVSEKVNKNVKLSNDDIAAGQGPNLILKNDLGINSSKGDTNDKSNTKELLLDSERLSFMQTLLNIAKSGLPDDESQKAFDDRNSNLEKTVQEDKNNPYSIINLINSESCDSMSTSSRSLPTYTINHMHEFTKNTPEQEFIFCTLEAKISGTTERSIGQVMIENALGIERGVSFKTPEEFENEIQKWIVNAITKNVFVIEKPGTFCNTSNMRCEPFNDSILKNSNFFNVVRPGKIRGSQKKFAQTERNNTCMEANFSTTLEYFSSVLIGYYLAVFLRYYERTVRFNGIECIVKNFHLSKHDMRIYVTVETSDKSQMIVALEDLPVLNTDVKKVSVVELMSGNCVTTYIVFKCIKELFPDIVDICSLVTSDIIDFASRLPEEMFGNIFEHSQYKHITEDAFGIVENFKPDLFLMICPPPEAGKDIKQKDLAKRWTGGGDYLALKKMKEGQIVAIVGELNGTDGIMGLQEYILESFEVLFCVPVENKNPYHLRYLFFLKKKKKG